MPQINRPASAATDVPEFITDLDGGTFERILSQALSESAAATVDHGKTSKVQIEFKIERIKGSHQVSIAHGVKFSKPTSMGKSSEETTGTTVLHVGKYGRLSLAQPSLLDQTSIPGA